jgi:predicted permease
MDDPGVRVASAWAEQLTPLPGELREPARWFMTMLLAVAALVLLIAATNAAGMLLARAATRGREIATRLAVGASRARLVRQLLVESALLCAAAGLAGVLLTWWVARMLNAWQKPFPIPIAVTFGLNATVLAVAAATVLGAALFAGLAPALHGTRIDLAAAMKEGGLQGGTRRTRTRDAFVVAQVALSVVLLAVAGLFGRSLQRTLAIDPGLRTAGVVHAGVNLPPHGYDEARSRALFAQLVARLRARPEIAAAAFAKAAPLSGNTEGSSTRRPDRPDDRVDVQWGAADVGLIELLGVPLLAGRTFTAADAPGTPPVAVINATVGERLWPNERPAELLGREILARGTRLTVVGVMGKGKYTFLQEDERGYAFRPLAQDFRPSAMLYVRARGAPEDGLLAARQELAALAPNVALERPTPLASDVARYLVPQRAAALLVSVFGVVGLFLAMTGVYGLLAYGVAQRMREFGVRMALGASAGDVVRIVVRHGLTLVLAGVALGVAGALAAGRLVARLLFGLSPVDAATLTAVPLLLVAVALLASAIPARRGAAADPMASLRAE